MAVKTVLGQVIIWCGKNDRFDKAKISNIKNEELNFWTEIQEITPPTKSFCDGNSTDSCKWYEAKVITNIEEKEISPPHLFVARMALNRALDSTPEEVSYRWKY